MGIQRLMQFECRVPPSWIITTALLEGFMGKTREETLHNILHHSIDAEDLKQLRSIFESHSGTWFARSSAIDEDGHESSFAGQYESVGGIAHFEQLLEAIKRVWASYFSDHVDGYREEAGHQAGMAVLLQHEIPCSFSGVLFTRHPLTQNPKEMVLESVKGRGSMLVDARVRPGYSLFSRSHSKLQHIPVLRGLHIRLKEESQHDQNPPLAQRYALCRMGVHLESKCKKGLDIEWTITADDTLIFLQMRPITGTKSTKDILWTREFLGERWTEPATELGWSEISDLICYLVDYPKTHAKYLGGGQAVRLFEHSPYINATIFRHLLFKLPKKTPTPEFFLEMLPQNEQKEWRAKSFSIPDWRVYCSIIKTTLTERRWQRFRWNPWSNYQKWQPFLLQLEHFLSRHSAPISTSEEAFSRIEDCVVMAKEYLKVHICSLIYANLWLQWARWKLRVLGYASKAEVVLRSHKRTATQRANRALWLLEHKQCTREEFFKEFGSRSRNSWALFAPRWVEDPQEVYRLASLMKEVPDPYLEEEEALRRLELEMKGFPEKIRKGLRITQEYLFLREEQRFHFERLLFIWKKSWLWLEEHHKLALRHLNNQEIKLWREHKLEDLPERIAQRKQSWLERAEQWNTQGMPPRFLLGDHPISYTHSGQTLKGVGISSGVYRGRARLLRSLDKVFEVEQGDILVVTTLDPGWTPLFLKAGGLIMELGGMLSHGAVIAREYKLPAVAGVEQAMNIITDGQELTIDGNTGVIWLGTKQKGARTL